MQYVPLTQVWAQNGLAAIVVGSLEDASFHPVTESDPRGPMQFYGWPLGSCWPVTIWVPSSELDEARSFLVAYVEPSWEPVQATGTGWSWASRKRRLLYSLWLAEIALGYALEVLLAGSFALWALIVSGLRLRTGR
jgi:hypothetical protein